MSQVDYEIRKSYLKILKLNGFAETFEKNILCKIEYANIYEQAVEYKVEVHLNRFDIIIYVFKNGVNIDKMTCLYTETFHVFNFIKKYI